MALGWIVTTSALGGLVRKPKRSSVVFPSLRSEVQPRVSIPAKKIGPPLAEANHWTPFPLPRGSEKLVSGTKQRLLSPASAANAVRTGS